MGIRNYLIEGVSGTGRTSVCTELQRRGYHAIHGDRELTYQGDPETGEPLDGFAREHDIRFVHEHHIWDAEKVKSLVADQRNRLHATTDDVPKNALSIDATAPIARVVDDILSKCGG